MCYCFLYPADIETPLLVKMNTANEKHFFFKKDVCDPDSVYRCKQFSKIDQASENVTIRDVMQP